MRKTRRIVCTVLAIFVCVISYSSFASASPNTNDGQRGVCEQFSRYECVETVALVDVGQIVINGKTFGVKDGLERHSIRIKLDQSSSSTDGIFSRLANEKNNDIQSYPTDWNPYNKYERHWGSSWATSEEILYLNYLGKTRAMANIYQGKRVIQTSVTYKRSGEMLGVARSNARYENRWLPGQEASVRVRDSLGFNDPKTEVYFDFYSINPQVTG